MSFPNTGKVLPRQRDDGGAAVPFKQMISTALLTSLVGVPSAIKLVARWTSANERTVKNWFAGETAPSGDHFLALAANSPAVLAAFLSAIGRQDCLAMAQVDEAREKVAIALSALIALRQP